MTDCKPTPDPADDIPNDLMTAKDGARLIKAHLATLHRWRLKGKLRAWRRGKLWFFSRADLLAIFRQHEARHTAPAASPKRVADWVEAELTRQGMRKADGGAAKPKAPEPPKADVPAWLKEELTRRGVLQGGQAAEAQDGNHQTSPAA